MNFYQFLVIFHTILMFSLGMSIGHRLGVNKAKTSPATINNQTSKPCKH